MRLICHRGWWWPDRWKQNHPSALHAALRAGWDVEVDVWRAHGDALKVGHDRPEHEWTLPSPDIGPGRLFLHLKSASTKGCLWSVEMHERVTEILDQAGWKDRTSLLISPAVHQSQMQVVTSKAQVSELAPQIHGVWVEQPDEEWADADDLAAIRAHGVPAYVVSSELYGRTINLAQLARWQTADGLVTDLPHLLTRLVDTNDPLVHPQEAWW